MGFVTGVFEMSINFMEEQPDVGWIWDAACDVHKYVTCRITTLKQTHESAAAAASRGTNYTTMPVASART